MPDFQTQPALTDTYTNVLSLLRDKETALAKMDYTTWTNIPTGAIRSNSSNSYKLERWNGTAWVVADFHTTIDNHIANTAIHQAINVGSVEMIAYGAADTGWLLCNGQAVSRSTYSALFAKIGVAYGAGDGSTTFNVPNLNGRSPIGVYSTLDAGYTADFASINAVGLATGNWNHTHTTPAHQHTVSGHTHSYYHLHGVPGHAHTIPDHAHNIPGHYHRAQGNGADIRVITSGAHTHTEDGIRSTSTGSGATTSYTWNTAGTIQNQTINSTSSDHVHDNADFRGRVGNVNGLVDGDTTFASAGAGVLTSNASSYFYVDGPVNGSLAADNNTQPNTAFSTPAGEGGGTTGQNNHRVLAFRFQIKT